MTMTTEEREILTWWASRSVGTHTIQLVVAVLAEIALKDDAIRMATHAPAQLPADPRAQEVAHLERKHALNAAHVADQQGEVSDGEIYSLAIFGGDREKRAQFIRECNRILAEKRGECPHGSTGPCSVCGDL